MSHKKRIHMVGIEYNDPFSPPQDHGKYRSVPKVIEYWCGKVDRVIVEEGEVPEDSPEEKVRLAKQREKHKARDIPVCAKCTRAKYNAKKWLKQLPELK